MEALAANVAASCPAAFSSVSGGMFAGAVAAVIAAHCAIMEDYHWPKDRSLEIIQKTSEGVSYDVIIVGAGTAGSLLAGRLAKNNPSWSILLVESGNDPEVDSEIPALLILNQNERVDWLYKTKPDLNSCLGFKDESCIWNKGKAMGGSSSINAMIYIRGHPSDFDNWKNLGNIGWGYKDLKPYFEKQESFLNFTKYAYNKNPWYDVMKEAAKELGLSFQEKHNNEAVVGTKIIKLLVKDGKRLNTAKLYLHESNNLHIMKDTTVQKVIINPETKVASGVEVRHTSGVVMQISVTKEVILSAGSIATPQILMLSGIGPKKHLNDNNIECLLDLPVGKNLQDHIFYPMLLKTRQDITMTPEVLTSFLLQYMLSRTGPLSSIGITDFMTFIHTKNLSQTPDIQFHHAFYTKNDDIMLTYFKGVGLKDDIMDAVKEINKKNSLLDFRPTLLHPKSKGEVLLANNDPTSKPVIRANYFQHPDDMRVLVEAIKYIHKIQQTNKFKSLGLTLVPIDIPGCTQFSWNTDAYWECYIKYMATTVYHAVGTAKMGPKNDDSSVVNHDLLVHGAHNLRVVDASIMPTIPSGNTMAATLMIAEKALDIIKKHYNYRSEL